MQLPPVRRGVTAHDTAVSRPQAWNALSDYGAAIPERESLFSVLEPVTNGGFRKFEYLTGLPCPGCGLTRAFSCILHGEFERGYDYHPFGYLLLPLFLLAATTLFLPASYRVRLEEVVRSRQSRLRRIYLTLIYGFITFGAVRIAVYAVQGLHAL